MEQYAAASYCAINNEPTSSNNITCPVDTCPLVEAAAATTLIEYQNLGPVDATGFVAVDHVNQLIVLAFRGSSSLANWIGDVDIKKLPLDLCQGCEVHAGFYASWALTRDRVKATLQSATASWPNYSIVSVGHSLGAAMATLGAAELRTDGYEVTLYSYGSPMVGNVALANFITSQGCNFRVTHSKDIVPKLPGYVIGFAHISPEYWIDAPSNVYPTTEDIQVSSGPLNLQGNGGTPGFSISDHLWYFNAVASCSFITLDPSFNVGSSLIHRLAGSCQQPAKALRPVLKLKHQRRSLFSVGLQSLNVRPGFQSRTAFQSRRCGLGSQWPQRGFSQVAALLQQQQPQHQEQAHDQEQGLSFQPDDLTQPELHDVFGPVTPPPRSANRLLRVLHARRVDGTLDLPFDAGLQAVFKRYPYAMESALYWLRSNYPVDEDAAIIARIEAEELGEEYRPSELRQRAQDVGLYAPREREGQTPYYGPQSGKYMAKLSEKEGDVFGRSEIDRIRAENIAKAEKEEQELQAQIDRITAEVTAKQAEQQSQALAARPEQGVETAQEIRPPNEFEKWILRSRNRAISKLTLDSPEVAEMTFTQRVLPSAVFVALFCVGCFLFAQYWVPPKRSERIFPDVSLSVATIGTIFALNLLAFACWGIPGMWPIMNRYFTSTPAYPRVLSMIGNTFSHQTATHFLTNMLGLFVFGLSLHEDVGRGNFLAIYLSSGAVGSLASLLVFSLRRQLVTSSLGASGSMWGIMAAYCWIHANEKFSFIFMTEEQRERIKFSGSTVLGCLVVFELVRFFLPVKTTDHASHLGGMLAGVIGAELWKRNEGADQGKQSPGLRCAYFNTTAWNRSWSIESGKLHDSQNAYAQIDSPANVYIARNVSSPEKSTYLALRTSRNAEFQSTAEIDCNQKNLKHSSIRARLRVIPNKLLPQPKSTSEHDDDNSTHPVAPGAVLGFFTFESNTEESDIEILTSDPTDRLRYSNQPDYDPKKGNSIPGTSTDYLMQDGRVWTDWLVHRLDWFPGVSQWWIDDDMVLNKTIHVPRKPSGMILNLWSDGGQWSGNMTVGDQVVVGVEWIEMVFNISASRHQPILATASSDKSVHIWSLRDWTLLSSIRDGHKRSVRCVGWKNYADPDTATDTDIEDPSASKRRRLVLASGSFDSNVGIWEYNPASSASHPALSLPLPPTLLTGPDSEIKSLAFAPAHYSATLLATSSRDKSVWIWEEVDADDGEWETVAVLQEHTGDVKCVAWCEGARLPSQRRIGQQQELNGDGTAMAVDGTEGGGGKERIIGSREQERIVGSREVLASGSYDDTIRLWRDVESEGDWVCIAVLEGHAGTVWSVKFEPYINTAVLPPTIITRDQLAVEWEPRLISCSDDLTVRVWKRELSDEEREKKQQQHLSHVNGSGGGSRLPSIIRPDSVVEEWTQEAVLPSIHVRSVYSIDWSKHSGLVVSCGGDGVIALYREVLSRPAADGNVDTNGATTTTTAAAATTWEIVAVVEAAHDEYEINHVCFAPRRDKGRRERREGEDEVAVEEVIVSTGDNGDVRIWEIPQL
ncbi:hypothetical protein DV735_g2450, partial [Chaetothyriales sp. CBS 134920]